MNVLCRRALGNFEVVRIIEVLAVVTDPNCARSCREYTVLNGC